MRKSHLMWAAACFLLTPRAVSAQIFEAYDAGDSFTKMVEQDYPIRSLYRGFFTVENAGVYPIFSVKVNGHELLRPGQVMAVGDKIFPSIRRFTPHTVELTFGAPLDPALRNFDPLRIVTFQNVQVNSYVRALDWTAENVLTEPPFWWFFYLDGQNRFVDSFLEFFPNGTYAWTRVRQADRATDMQFGTYVGGAANTFSVTRDVHMTPTGGFPVTVSLDELGADTLAIPVDHDDNPNTTNIFVHHEPQ